MAGAVLGDGDIEWISQTKPLLSSNLPSPKQERNTVVSETSESKRENAVHET